jgi:hypothetical protein
MVFGIAGAPVKRRPKIAHRSRDPAGQLALALRDLRRACATLAAIAAARKWQQVAPT